MLRLTTWIAAALVAALAPAAFAEPCDLAPREPVGFACPSSIEASVLSDHTCLSLGEQDLPAAPTGRQPGAASDFPATFAPPGAKPSITVRHGGSDEGDSLGVIFSPGGVGGIFYVAVALIGLFYRWQFRRMRQRSVFVTQTLGGTAQPGS